MVSINEVVENSDIIIIGAPHSKYKEFTFDEELIIVDMWGIENIRRTNL